MDYQSEQIYNIYQRVTGTLSGKPFKYRHNFENFDKKEPEKYTALTKIVKILKNLPGVNPEKYFEAPYKIFGSEFDGTIIGLDFYCKPRAIRAYTNYISSQMITDENLLSEEARNKVLQGFRHIVCTCRDTKCDYSSYFSSSDNIPMFIDDLNHGLINKWVLAGLRLCGYDFFGCIDFDFFPEAEFMFGSRDINETLDNMLSRLSEREVKWLSTVTMKIKTEYFDKKPLD